MPTSSHTTPETPRRPGAHIPIAAAAFLFSSITVTFLGASFFGLFSGSWAAFAGMVWMLGLYLVLFSLIVGIPIHLFLIHRSVRHPLIYGLVGFVFGAAVLVTLPDQISLDMMMSFALVGGILGFLNASIFSAVFNRMNR